MNFKYTITKGAKLNGVTPETVDMIGDDGKIHLVPKTEVEEHFNYSLLILFLIAWPFSLLMHYAFYKTHIELK